MGLVASVVLGAETPVNIRENRVVLEADDAEDTAAYLDSSLFGREMSRTGRGLYAFSTFSATFDGKEDFSLSISPFLSSWFCCSFAKLKTNWGNPL